MNNAVPGRIVYFDESGAPCEERLTLAITWIGLTTGLMRPYGDSIHACVRRVYGHLGLPWKSEPSQTTAVLLALFGGICALHLFYLGDRRRALKQLRFFWTGVPFVIGIFEGIRIALLDRREFVAKYWSA